MQAENLTAALGAAIVLALRVNTVELLCTAGFPALYTHVLAQRQLPPREHYGYLALYNAAYMFDDGLLVPTSVLTMHRFKLQERGGRRLKLISGAVLLALGLMLLLQPAWLEFEMR